MAPSLTHAGGVVFRMTDGHAVYLLVQSLKSPADWVLPKGHIERGEKPEATAEREVREETGVQAHIVAPLDTISFSVRDETVTAAFFLMAATGETSAVDEGRATAWLSLSQALDRATHAETRYLLALADKKTRGLL